MEGGIMRIAIEHLLALWDEKELGKLNLSMDMNITRDSQVFSVEKEGIQKQVACTKAYLLELKEKSPYAMVRYSKELIAHLKSAYPTDYRGIIRVTSLGEATRIVTQIALLNKETKRQREVLALSNENNASVRCFRLTAVSTTGLKGAAM